MGEKVPLSKPSSYFVFLSGRAINKNQCKHRIQTAMNPSHPLESKAHLLEYINPRVILPTFTPFHTQIADVLQKDLADLHFIAVYPSLACVIDTNCENELLIFSTPSTKHIHCSRTSNSAYLIVD